MTPPTRRTVLAGCAALGACGSDDPIRSLRTPYKLNRLVLAASGVGFDRLAVDCPFVFLHEGAFHMTYIGFDGTGYQTGIATSPDLVNWRREGVILPRDPSDPITRYNVAAASILRENALSSPGRLVRVNEHYVTAWHAYPQPGYEAGRAVIGLAFSKDLRTWKREAPILFAEDGAPWERGGLYKPFLTRIGEEFLLFYNAKTEGADWREQIGVATSRDLRTWTRHPANPLIRNSLIGPDAKFASDPFVVTHGGEWAMFYFGLGLDGKARELVATGSPFNWTKGGVLIEPTPGTCDSRYAHKPALISHGGDLYHFYCAVDEAETRGVGVARSRAWARRP